MHPDEPARYPLHMHTTHIVKCMPAFKFQEHPGLCSQLASSSNTLAVIWVSACMWFCISRTLPRVKLLQSKVPVTELQSSMRARPDGCRC